MTDILSRPINGRLPSERTAGSRNVVELGMAAAECRAALEEFNRTLPSFCKRLDIPPAWLNLSTPELLMLVCMRQQAVIDELAAAVNTLRFPPVQE
jgi:hypothetical protein